jgi:hypothetical protein
MFVCVSTLLVTLIAESPLIPCEAITMILEAHPLRWRDGNEKSPMPSLKPAAANAVLQCLARSAVQSRVSAPGV